MKKTLIAAMLMFSTALVSADELILEGLYGVMCKSYGNIATQVTALRDAGHDEDSIHRLFGTGTNPDYKEIDLRTIEIVSVAVDTTLSNEKFKQLVVDYCLANWTT